VGQCPTWWPPGRI